MAPLPGNSTAVLYVDYTTGRRAHTFQVRFDNVEGPSAAGEAALAFLEPLALVLPPEWAITGTRYRAIGSSITLPIQVAGLEDFTGNGPASLAEVNEPQEWVWVGRGLVSGRRVEVSLYGLLLATPDDYRYTSANAPPSLNAARAALEGGAPSNFITIGGDLPVWYPYVNVNNNSYWETRARRSA